MADKVSKKGTNQFMRMGQTASIYGNDPAVPHGGKEARELKP